MSEKINHPAHYGGADDPFEVIKILEAKLTPEEYRGFLKGNVERLKDLQQKQSDSRPEPRKE